MNAGGNQDPRDPAMQAEIQRVNQLLKACQNAQEREAFIKELIKTPNIFLAWFEEQGQSPQQLEQQKMNNVGNLEPDMQAQIQRINERLEVCQSEQERETVHIELKQNSALYSALYAWLRAHLPQDLIQINHRDDSNTNLHYTMQSTT